LTTVNAKEAKHEPFLSAPYYRFHLHRRNHSAQHDQLIALENSKLGNVHYAALKFHASEDLDAHYTANQVIDNSIFFSPNVIGPLPNNKEHYMVFREADNYGFFCSDEPKKVPSNRLPAWLLRGSPKLRKGKMPSLHPESASRVVREALARSGPPRPKACSNSGTFQPP
jgi:hypothetical protein